MVELTRRGFLGAVGAGVLLPAAVRVPAAAAAPGALSGFDAGRALRAAMHVHGSWSEGTGSWQAQFQQAAAGGYDLLYLTDHDIRMLARGYLTSLSGVALAGSSTGTFAQKAATASGGGLRLLAESASATAAAAATLTLPEAMAKSALRTSISGFTIRQTVTRATLSGGATYEITVPLSYHPATGGRPAGQYTIVYRFGGTAGRSVQGLTGTVSAPAPAAGAVLTLSPETDAAALWPELLAIDNGAAGLSFTARSPHRGAVADVTIGSTTFARARSTAAAVIADQARVVAAYQPQHPGLTARASTEVSISHPHANPFGLPQWLPDYGSLPTAHDAQYRAIVDQVHAGGGVISWNHPFGDDNPPLLAPAARDTKRRQVFADMLAVDLFGMDVVEVGYNSRGGVDAATHLALWDTFSRAGRFLTGNGTSDDHSGKGWKNLNNGYATGLWAASTSDAAVSTALSTGRAFAVHAGRWPGGEIDLLVDGTVPMGGVSVGGAGTRQLAIAATALPAGSSVQVVSGPVDYTGAVDPGTTVVSTLTAAAFAHGPVTMPVSASASRFYRAQVVSSAGVLLGSGNPVWLLRESPPVPVPPGRRH